MTQLVVDDLAIEVSMKKLNPQQLFPKPKPFRYISLDETTRPESVEHAKNFVDSLISLPSGEKVLPLTRQRTYYSRNTGEKLGTTQDVTYKDLFVDPLGEEVTMDMITWLIEKDGELKPVKPYSRTKIMQGLYPISRSAVENWIPESAYEVYVNKGKYNQAERSRMKGRLFDKAEEWYNNDKAMIGQWVFREGAQPYVMILFPYIKKLENSTFQFCFVAYFSRTKNEYQHLMETTPLTTSVEIVEEPDTNELLAAIAK